MIPAYQSIYLDWYFYPLQIKTYELAIVIKYSPVIKDDFFNSFGHDDIDRINEGKSDYSDNNDFNNDHNSEGK